MACFTLSADEIKAAPLEVRRWLEEQMLRAIDKGTMPDHPAKDSASPPKTLESGEPRRKALVPPTNTVIAAKSSGGTSNIEPADRDVAIHTIIAERAYELWENQGKPHGCDLIHWREAEQEIMDCVGRTRIDGAPGASGLRRD